MVRDKVQDTNQLIHNVGMAASVGGAMFGQFAHNPSLRHISSPAERGAVSNAAWNSYNAINAASLAVVGAGHLAGRLTELRTANLSAREQPLVQAMDVLTATGVVSGILNGVQGARLARRAPGGAVPIQTGLRPAPETPQQARRIQRSLSVLGLRGTCEITLQARDLQQLERFYRRALGCSVLAREDDRIWLRAARTPASESGRLAPKSSAIKAAATSISRCPPAPAN